MKKAGMALMIIGALLVALQMLSMIGNARMGNGLELTGDLAFDIGFCVGYFFFGAQGLAAFILGLVLRLRSAKHEDDEQK